jgi:3-oxoacyl-[acyl-carrier protein] reductase
VDLGLKNKRVLITAGSQGLGRASALSLAGEGARVAIASRRIEVLESLVGELKASGSPDACAVKMDLSDPAAIKSAVASAAERWGGLDIVVGNTGGPTSGPFLSIARETWQEALDAMLMPMIDLCQAAIPIMIKSGGGRIVFITTVGVKVVQPNMVLSDSIRLAIIGLGKSLAIEHAKDNILVNCLCPGPIATDRMDELVTQTMTQRGISREDATAIWVEEVPLARMAEPREFGDVLAMLVSERSSYVTGQAIAVDGGKARAY